MRQGSSISMEDAFVLAIVAMFIVPTLLLGFVLRRPLMGFNQNLLRELESTKLM